MTPMQRGRRRSAEDVAARLDDPALEPLGGIVRTNRDDVFVAIERRPDWHYPAVLIQVLRQDFGDPSPRRMASDKISLRLYEIRSVANLLLDAAARLDDEYAGDEDDR